MKNAEGVSLPSELEQRLKQSIDHLRDVREVLEELGRSADVLHRLFGVEQVAVPTRAAPPPRPVERAAKARAPQKEQTATTPPPAKGSAHPPPGNAPPAPQPEDEIPEWRKVFPELSSEVPGRGK
jgi:hypothetical protein